MTQHFQAELEPMLRAVAILGPATFLFRGEPVQVRPGPVQSLPGFPAHPLPESPLVRDLQAQLYHRCYTRRLEEEQAAQGAQQFTPDPSFAQRLSASNRSQQRWEGGWIVYSLAANGSVSLHKGDRQRNAVPGEFIHYGVPGVPAQNGAMVSVYAPRESFTAQPGFYYIYGETLADVWDDHALVRFYFHSTSEGAPLLVEFLSTTLNRYQVPFRMKTLTEPSMYQRRDATVLYVARRHYGITARLVQDLPRDVAAALRPSVPLFSRPLRDGVGIAEDPGTGESFGMHRCRMVAEGIVDAWMRSDQSVEGRRAAIAARFTANGCSLDFPHLSPGSVDFSDVAMKVDFAYA